MNAKLVMKSLFFSLLLVNVLSLTAQEKKDVQESVKDTIKTSTSLRRLLLKDSARVSR